MKRGQIQIIFTWIFILILIGLTLVYGIKFVQKTKQLGEDVVLVNFFQNLNDKIQLYYSLDVGSKGNEEFKLNNQVKYVCFTKEGALTYLNSLTKEDNEYLDNLNEFDSVFIIPPVYKNNRMNITHLVVDINPNCVDVSGGLLRLNLETTKDGVKVGQGN